MTTTFKSAEGESADYPGSSVQPTVIGDGKSFVALHDRYARTIYNLALRSARDRQLAEDICQEVWLKVYRHITKLREEEAFASWLYRIAARTCISAARVKAAGPQQVELTEAVSDRTAGPESQCLGNEETRLVWEALGSLSPRHQIALYLREVEGRSYDQIAAALDTSHSAVETLLFRARLSFAKNYARLEASPAERCREASQAMAAVLDHEATSVQRLAIEAHLGGCSSCRQTMNRIRAASVAYGAMPLTHVPASVTTTAFGSAALVTTGEVLSKSGFLVFLAKAKSLAFALLISAGLTAGSVAVERSDLWQQPTSAVERVTPVPQAGEQGLPRNKAPSDAQSTAAQPALPRQGVIARESDLAVADSQPRVGAGATSDRPALTALDPASQGPNFAGVSAGIDLGAPSVGANLSIGGASGGVAVQAGVSVGGTGLSATSKVSLTVSLPATAAKSSVATRLNAGSSSGVTTTAGANAGIAPTPAGLSASGGVAVAGSVKTSASPPVFQTTVNSSGNASLNTGGANVNTSTNVALSPATLPAVLQITPPTSPLGH
jgi:RNA polymerase sigma-70 factor (ECF subfamily)